MEEQVQEISFSNAKDILFDKLVVWWESLVKLLPNLVLAVIVIVLSIFVVRFIRGWVEKFIRRTTRNRTLVSFGSNLFTAVFFLAVGMVVLNILDLSDAVKTVLGAAGVLGLAVGLALQDPMVNLFSGIMMSVRDYYTVGDLVKTNDYFGTITKITLRTTVLLQPDGQEVIIPNKDILQNPLTNYSHNGHRRIDIDCGVAYGDNLEEAAATVRRAVEDHVDHDSSKPVQVFFKEFGDSSINFQLRYWKDITAQGDFLESRHQAIIAVKKALDEGGFTIPFPIRTLDFGVVGGVPLNELYPKSLLNGSKNGAKTNESVNKTG